MLWFAQIFFLSTDRPLGRQINEYLQSSMGAKKKALLESNFIYFNHLKHFTQPTQSRYIRQFWSNFDRSTSVLETKLEPTLQFTPPPSEFWSDFKDISSGVDE